MLLIRLLIFILSLMFLSYAQESSLIQRQKIIMGTYITLKIPEEHMNLFKPAFEIFKRVDNLFSVYKKDSHVSRVNESGCYRVNQEVLNLTKKSIEICKETNGYFNIAVGRITEELFGFGTESERIPKENELEEASKRISCDSVRIEGNMVCLREGVKIDFGGIAKGYAVDRVYEFLKEKGVKKGIILASGDIRCISECEVYIKNPFGNGNLFKLVLSENTAISTSGNYERFIGEKKYNHLINPKTGKPEKTFASVTLISKKENTLIDAYATAISVMPLKEALLFLKNHRDIGAILITNDRELYITDNIYRLVKKILLSKN